MTNFTESGITPVQFVFDRELIEKLDGSGPRYTSYPTADRFTDAFSEADYHHWLKQRRIGACARGVSLYAHIPFCNTVCYYCACNKIITKDKSRADTYLDYLERELALHAEYLQGHPQLAQLHFGGGTPTFLSDAQMTRLMQAIGRHFQLVPHGEYSIEIDPRKVTADNVKHLASLGFILNWFGDSLDGSLARYRHEERPNYGYFLDHSIDGFTALCIFIGLGMSNLANLSVAMLALAFYLMLMNSVSLKTHATGVFEMTSIKIGPTEIRLIAILFNTYAYFFGNPMLPGSIFLDEELTVGTLVVGIIGALMFLYFIYQTLRTSMQLAREDEEALAQRKAKELTRR